MWRIEASAAARASAARLGTDAMELEFPSDASLAVVLGEAIAVLDVAVPVAPVSFTSGGVFPVRVSGTWTR